jgi:DNA-binding NtrC family response regulator
VRELENAIERAAALCDGDIIQLCDLPPQHHKLGDVNEPEDVREEAHLATVSIPDSLGLYPGKAVTPSATPIAGATTSSSSQPPVAAAMTGSFHPLKNYLREQEVAYLQRTLAFTGNDKEKAAEILGVSLATLYRKLAEVDEGN